MQDWDSEDSPASDLIASFKEFLATTAHTRHEGRRQEPEDDPWDSDHEDQQGGPVLSSPP